MSDQQLIEELRQHLTHYAFTINELLVDSPRGRLTLGQLADQVDRSAHRVALRLSWDDQETATKLYRLLWRRGEAPNEWWATATGRAVAGVLGGPPGATTVTLATAGAMLGYSKQYVHKLTQTGQLDVADSGGVTTGSIRQRLRRAAPEE
jgi:hypothetical protein